MRSLQHLVLLALVAHGLAVASGGYSRKSAAADKFYRIVDGKVDARTYNGYRRDQAGCIHCHGPDGVGSTFASSLVARPCDKETFSGSFATARAVAGPRSSKALLAIPILRPISTTFTPICKLVPMALSAADGRKGRRRRAFPAIATDTADRSIEPITPIGSHCTSSPLSIRLG